MSQQSEFFSGIDLPETDYLEELKKHYEKLARAEVLGRLREHQEVDSDDLYALGLRYPMVQERSLRAWLSEAAVCINLGAGDRVPKIESGHRLRGK
jgi:hypothetical protein